MISKNLQEQITKALKEKDEVRLSTLRMLSAALHNAVIDKRGKVSGDIDKVKLLEEEETEVVQKEAKKRKDAIEAYEKAGAKDRALKEKEELKILQEYLPKELSEGKLEKIVGETISELGVKDIKEMGKVIGQVMMKVKGRADGKKVSELVRRKLS